MLISPAYAQAGGADGGSALLTFLPLILIFVVFYFLLIRPQQKRQKEHKAMVQALRRGDRVVTAGGIYGTVARVISDTEVDLEIAEGVKVRMLRGTVQEIVGKGQPVERGSKARGRKKEEADEAQDEDEWDGEDEQLAEDDSSSDRKRR
ncbi:preprotein translocase subunit YajC [Algihabitans albus]|uniref:preprotein translocase subunit YajC n=1 Tax=Algihabitans albus TaxID=2164067 RepID=UPI000E5D412A|nr:preprotein translocase subunit YajC [Algihabitans albus]